MIDRAGKVTVYIYIYICAGHKRRLQTNRLSPEEGARSSRSVPGR